MKFKYLNNKVADIVEQLGQKAPSVGTMKDEDLQLFNQAIENTIGGIKEELTATSKALSEVIKAIQGEIARRGIAKRVENQLSMFDNSKLLEAPKKKTDEVIAEQQAPVEQITTEEVLEDTEEEFEDDEE